MEGGGQNLSPQLILSPLLIFTRVSAHFFDDLLRWFLNTYSGKVKTKYGQVSNGFKGDIKLILPPHV